MFFIIKVEVLFELYISGYKTEKGIVTILRYLF